MGALSPRPPGVRVGRPGCVSVGDPQLLLPSALPSQAPSLTSGEREDIACLHPVGVWTPQLRNVSQGQASRGPAGASWLHSHVLSRKSA